MIPCPLCLGLKQHAPNCPDAPDVKPEPDSAYDNSEDSLDEAGEG